MMVRECTVEHVTPKSPIRVQLSWDLVTVNIYIIIIYIYMKIYIIFLLIKSSSEHPCPVNGARFILEETTPIRNVSSWDKVDQSEELCVDMHMLTQTIWKKSSDSINRPTFSPFICHPNLNLHTKIYPWEVTIFQPSTGVLNFSVD